MKADDLILVSVDDHVVEPPDMFENHLSAEYKSKAPRVVRKKDGTDVWVFNDQQLPNIGLNAVVGRKPEEYGMEPTSYDQMRPGCWNIHERIRDMNVNGVLAQLCFPSFPSFSGGRFAALDDKKLALVLLQAYNDWHIDEWCGAYEGRFMPLALPVMWDPEIMAEEVRRVARKGCHAVSFTDGPEKQGYPSIHTDHWDPVWKACQDEGTVVCVHIGSGGGMTFTSMEAPVDVMITVTPMTLANFAADLLWSQILRKFPKIKFALSEGGIGWIPYFLERVDYVYKHHNKWTRQDFGDALPSDIFRRNVITCFIDDKVGVANRAEVGIDTITWECDYPHSDTTWPTAPEILWDSLDGVPEDEIHKMTWGNATRAFQFDPFQHRPKEKCTAAALRAESPDVDLAPFSTGGKPPTLKKGGFITTKEVTEQLATAFATPAE
jgi:predicted TIM-barrel fold metal-dependent hydrolase